MDRTRMIQILSAIQGGNINPEDLVPGRGYFLKEETEGVFRDIHSGIAYTQAEIDALAKDMDRRDAMRKALLSDAATEPLIIIKLPDKVIEPTIPTTIPVNTPEVVEQPEVIEQPAGTVNPEPEQKEPKPKNESRPQGRVTFNLKGELKDIERAQKMDEFKHINNQL